jgi:hypothetical protein
VTIKVFLDGAPRHSQRGWRYRLILADGEFLMSDAADPLIDAARTLRARGASGMVAIYGENRARPIARGCIELLAERGIEDRRYVPFHERGQGRRKGLAHSRALRRGRMREVAGR